MNLKEIVHGWIVSIRKLKSVRYNNHTISYDSINSFNIMKRSDNDINNKIRETIIGSIINNKIDNDYYKYSLRWNRLKYSIDLYVKELCKIKNIEHCYKVECFHKGNRNNHYDFDIVINKEYKFNVEFKFNCKTLSDAPQFVSPMNPSQYLESSYEEYFYDNYLIQISNEFMTFPTKEEYITGIHKPKPVIVRNIQNKYYRGCKKSSRYSGNIIDIEFYEKMVKLSSESIESFIHKYNIKIDKLTEYLLKSQENKVYMLYQNGLFYIEHINRDKYIITDVKKEKNTYIASTKSNDSMKILLRWKNGNGIAYPAFQIS